MSPSRTEAGGEALGYGWKRGTKTQRAWTSSDEEVTPSNKQPLTLRNPSNRVLDCVQDALNPSGVVCVVAAEEFRSAREAANTLFKGEL